MICLYPIKVTCNLKLHEITKKASLLYSSDSPSLQVLHYLQHINFTTSQGERVTFDQSGDPPARYELINLQRVTPETMHVSTVGVFDATLPRERQFTMNGMKIVWGGGGHTVHVHIALFSHFWIVSHNTILQNI